MTRAAAVLAACCLAGCAVARVEHPDGTAVTAIAVGHAAVLDCGPGGTATSPAGALLGPCTRVAGGDLSTTFAGIVSIVASAAAAALTTGGWW